MNNPDPGIVTIRPTTATDYGELFTLQRAAYLDEGRLYGTLDVPALSESMSELTDRLTNSHSWVAIAGSRIVGAVSLRAYHDTPELERLMVAPDRRGEGISSRLLVTVERSAFDAGHSSLSLVVGDLAFDNQRFYEHRGWVRTDSFNACGFDNVLLHRMTKKLTRH